MEAALPGVIIIGLLMLVMFTIAYGYFSSQDVLMKSWREMEERLGDRARTHATAVEATTAAGGDLVEVTIRNAGDTKLADFDHWDVIVQYHETGGSYYVEWLPYNGVTQDRWWGVGGLYVDASAGTPEAYEPDIFNPTEELVVQLWLSPTVAIDSVNLVTIATPNGISASTVFTYAGGG